jgi:hypothetical protein
MVSVPPDDGARLAKQPDRHEIATRSLRGPPLPWERHHSSPAATCPPQRQGRLCRGENASFLPRERTPLDTLDIVDLVEWLILLAVCIALPAVSARTGYFKRLLAAVIVLVALFGQLIVALSARTALDAPSDPLGTREACREGIVSMQQAANRGARIMLFAVAGLTLLIVVPQRSERF